MDGLTGQFNCSMDTLTVQQQYALNAATIAARSLLPKIQLEKFDGDVSMFRIFRKSYHSIVESNLVNDSEESKLVIC